MDNEYGFARGPAGGRAGRVTPAVATKRRVAGAPGHARLRARLRRALRALPPAAVPLQPLDRAQRRRRPRRAAVDLHGRAVGTPARSPQRPAAPMALSNRPQRGDLAVAATQPRPRRAVLRCRDERVSLGGGRSRRPGALVDAARGPRRAPGSAAERAAVTGVERALARGDRD